MHRTLTPLIALILTFSNCPAWAVPNPHIFNEKDLAKARVEVDGNALGKEEVEPIRAVVIKDLIYWNTRLRKMPKTKELLIAPSPVKLSFKEILRKVNNEVRFTERPPETVEMWLEIKSFLEEAQNPARWVVSPEDSRAVRQYSQMSNQELQGLIESGHSFPGYRLTDLDWNLFVADLSVDLWGAIIGFKKMIQDYNERLRGVTSFLKMSEAKEALEFSIRHKQEILRMLREWAYRHWDGTGEASSLGRRRAKALPRLRETDYEEIFRRTRIHAKRQTNTEQKKMWNFAKEFFAEAIKPSSWRFRDAHELREMESYAKLPSREIERLLNQEIRPVKVIFHVNDDTKKDPNAKLKIYRLGEIDWDIFKGDFLPNFLYSHIQRIEMWKARKLDYKREEWFRRGEKFSKLFREWVYRHWNQRERRPASHTLLAQTTDAPKALSLGVHDGGRISFAHQLGSLVLERNKKERFFSAA